MANSVTSRIVQTSFLMSLCYLVIGLLLAILPSFVHLRLGFTPVWAGTVVGAQYAATLLSRPRAGLLTDFIGPKAHRSMGAGGVSSKWLFTAFLSIS